MEFFNLNEKVAIVTGGNGGIGLAYAKGLVKAGAKVAIWGRNETKNLQAIEELQKLGGNVAVFAADVTDVTQVQSAFDATIAKFGKVDICFANAGSAGPTKSLVKLTDEAWSKLLDINLNSVVYTYRLVIKHLLEREAPGKLIVTSSIAALVGSGYATGYSTTKAAVLGLTRSLAVELGKKDIQVNAILPGYVGTEMTANAPDVFLDGVKRRSCSGKLGTVEQMEGVAVFLASASSDFITGQSIVMDGGHLVYPY